MAKGSSKSAPGSGGAQSGSKGVGKSRGKACSNYRPKMRKFRECYVYAAYEGGFDMYWSTTFSRSGVWYEKWNAPDARVHEDIWWAPYMLWRGYAFWPHEIPEPLSDEELLHLWPGLTGRPGDDSDSDESGIRVWVERVLSYAATAS